LCVVGPNEVGTTGGKDDEFTDSSGAKKLLIKGERSGGNGGIEEAGLCVVDPDDVGAGGDKDDKFVDGSGAKKLVKTNFVGIYRTQTGGDRAVKGTSLCVVDPNDVGLAGGKDDEFANGSRATKLVINGEGSGGDRGVEGTQVCGGGWVANGSGLFYSASL
jgi:hypothetical protein